ncbi:MAG: glutamate synthase large subunit, partial [Bacteroidales bacterium]|nr:glutamate synthase large subunit [Bacteroidales bacterium]
KYGLYDAASEHDACGIGMVVNIRGDKTHELVDNALTVLENMSHRGAEGADGKSGDGAGILVQIPHEFILLQGIPVPEKGRYGTGLMFLPKDAGKRDRILESVRTEVEHEGCILSHIREVPVNSACLGKDAAKGEPYTVQIFVTSAEFIEDTDFERKLYRIRKHVERLGEDCYICSLSTRNIVYKGMLTSRQLREYYTDLTSQWFTSAMAIVHSRFSTNTFPQWSLAQPFRMLCHNGEINTIRGNRSWMQARQSVLNSGRLGDIGDLTPIVQPDMSDSASLDNVLEFLTMSGLSLPQAVSVLMPESFDETNPISEDLRAFYEYHSILMEPWDGPATLLFSDGRYAGGIQDRNGLRPGRYTITKRGILVLASEVGVLDLDPTEIECKGRLEPGKMLLVDTKEGKIWYDSEIKEKLASEHPYRKWLSAGRIQLEDLHSGRKIEHNEADLLHKEILFGCTAEDVENTLRPMCERGIEATSSMGNDTPLAVLTERPQSFFNYFRQQFAQVTNPPIDSIREQMVMSLFEYIGRVGTGILTPDEDNCKMVRLPHPILTNTQLDLLCNIRYKGFNTVKLPMLFECAANAAEAASNLRRALTNLCRKAEKCVDDGVNYIILSDRDVDETHAPIPSLLAVSAVHHHLIAAGKRVQTALIVESGEIRETMHAALLLGYGASAINPYLSFAIISSLTHGGKMQLNYATARANYIEAMKKGLLKIMAKMGISTIRSYRGARIFESVGLDEGLLHEYFGTDRSTIGGIGLETIARDAMWFHAQAYADAEHAAFLPNVGLFHYRKGGIPHAWNPETISSLQISTRLGSYKKFKEFTAAVDGKADAIFLRDLLDYKRGAPISIDKVEPVEDIVKRFVVSAMSFGALSIEAHEAIALAMNRLGSRSNTGEGGEDNERYHTDVDGVSLSSKTKQVASGRFGVTAEYLVNAEEIQIKVAQGAKPGEGGQLPGFKVNAIIAKTRNSIPGISLISPPPHHDIYSIEDLSQLIFDLKNVNPAAAISVKLVSESGVGTIAAGVAKAKADLIVVSGAEGGTGAAPASSMRFAGISPEIGLSEAQQTLVRNGLRGQVRLQVDGQIKTGRDVILLSLLGADEFGFGTLPLIVLGCVMMRKCSLNTCPTGVATQDPELRKHFLGKADYLVNYFTFLAQEVREYLAEMGYTKLSDIIGHTDLLVRKPDVPASKASYIDLSRLLFREEGASCWAGGPLHDLPTVRDMEIIKAAQPAIEWKEEISLEYPIANTDRAACTMLSGRIAAKYGAEGLPDSTVNIKFKGSAGQSFCAFLAAGVNVRLEGEANDYVGKGLSGGRVAIRPSTRATFKAEENTIAGNTCLYGATGGEMYIAGRVGQRFAVRNSGAKAVVEGAGDHCCEYMTGGRVVVLGPVGRNFAAGMSGGVAYIYDPGHVFDYYCNLDMVEISLVDDKLDRKELHELVRQHYLYTGSGLARTLLDDWTRSIDDFVKVIPIEYKHVLEQERLRSLAEKVQHLQIQY